MTFDVTGLEARPKRRKNGIVPGYRYFDLTGSLVGKTCSSCKVVKTISEFHSASTSHSPDGYQALCKNCNSTAGKKAYIKYRTNDPKYSSRNDAAVREKYRQRSDIELAEYRQAKYPDGCKRCASCGLMKMLSEYYAHTNRADGLRRLCRLCEHQNRTNKRREMYESYWGAGRIQFECYLCGGAYEEIEHLIPISHRHGSDVPTNTRPACTRCNRGPGGKFETPLEHYIFSVNHPTKTRAQILYEIVMSGTWPFALTTPEEFVEQCKTLEEAECTSR